jgi:CubicO group peptidase (beta-lactamase class C family)
MKEIILTVTISLIFCCLDSQVITCQSRSQVESIENGLSEFTSPKEILQSINKIPLGSSSVSQRMSYYKVPGLSIALINNNTIEWNRTYGTINNENNLPVNTETLFEAASTTKLLTALITLHFVEKGVLDLDKDVNDYLIRWKIPENEFTVKNRVTLRLLLTHQSGMNKPEGGFSSTGVPSIIQTLNGETPATNPPANIESKPGSTWSYSNFGYIVIQLILEDVLKLPFYQIAGETVFSKIGMKNSTLRLPLSDEKRINEAMPHSADGKAHISAVDPNSLAHGGLMTTPSDLGKLLIELMKVYNGKSDLIISHETAKKMFSLETAIDPKDMFGLSLGEGLGVFLSGKGDSFSFLHPGSNLPGSECWIIGFPGTGKGVAIMANGEMGSLLAMEIIAAISTVYDWPTFKIN